MPSIKPFYCKHMRLLRCTCQQFNCHMTNYNVHHGLAAMQLHDIHHNGMVK